MTIWLSFIMFKFIDGEPEIENKYLKPASWLSAMISANSIALHIALSEGVTVAWWYKASRSDVTLRELHDTWVMGTSTMGVLFSGKRFNYVAMGTLFVATIPLNGFLLQNAISYDASTKTNSTTLHIPVSSQLPSGFSGDLSNGTVGSWSDAFTTVVYYAEGLNVPYPPGYYLAAGNDLGLVGCVDKDNTAVCKGNATITGFSMDCSTRMNQTYDFRPEQHISDQPFRQTVYSSSVTWQPTEPNVINLSVLYKPNATCNGLFEELTCKFEAVNMSVPIQIQGDQGFYQGTSYSSNAYAYPVIAIDANSTSSDFVVHNTLPVSSEEGQTNTTFGAIAEYLGLRYNGSIDWTLLDGRWSSNSTGILAKTYKFEPYIYPEFPNGTIDYDPNVQTFLPKVDNATWCRHTYSGADYLADAQGINPASTIWSYLNSLMLGAAAIETTNEYTDFLINDYYNDPGSNLTGKAYNTWYDSIFLRLTQTWDKASATQPALRYNIRFKYWGASVTVTTCVILMIVPLFWGFWTLDRRATLSPFETAAAFDAKPLEGVDMKKGTTVLLQEIGRQPLHNSGYGSGSNSRNVSEIRLNPV